MSRSPTRFKFSLLALLVAVTAVGIVVGTMLNATPLLVGAAATACFIIYTAAAIAAVYRRGPGQAFAGGFFIAGAGYLALLNYLLANSTLQGTLLTGWLLVWSHEQVVRDVPDPAYAGMMASGGMPATGVALAGGNMMGGPGGAGGAGGGMPAGMAGGMSGYGGSGSMAGGGFVAPTIQVPWFGEYRDLGHYYWSLLFALCGGLLARRFFAARAAPS